ncbi:hypothetical protein ACJIZ3_012102 [Penstemon smallii]|uniref:Bifunctional inhibitor/plant lipid transfer protein/seed storage helical domain-containing protein n=1 Tax=Penstemon smallii TaxID=265156 RepID=A0ABD3ULF1_9LAMI
MAKAKTTTTTSNNILLIAAVFMAALPHITGQLPPASGPMLPAAPGPMIFPMAPSPGLDCMTYLFNLSDCLTFVGSDSNLTKPDPGCCPELANLVNTQPICLCELIGDPGRVGISIDTNKALKLPSVCNVTTPPVSLCAAIGIPVSSAPSEAPLAGGGSVAASPSPGNENNEAQSSLAPNQQFLVGLATLLLFTYFF